MKHPFFVVLATVVAPLSVAMGQSDSPPNSIRLPAVVVTAPETPPEATTVSTIEIPDIQSSQIRETEDLSARVPNFSISSASLHSFGDIYSIRGITNTIFFSDPAVAMYVDGVPSGDAFSFFQPLYDVSHVDIYRGPQPSLFGLNGEAGLISIQTQPATNDWHGSALASYSSYNTQDYRFTLSGPLVKDKLTISLSGDQTLSSGFIDNTFLQRRTDSRNDLSGRALLTWTPLPDWTIKAGVESGYAMDGSQRIVSLSGNPLQVSSDVPGSLETHETRVWLDITKRFETWQVQNIASYSRFDLNQELDLDLTPASATLAGVFPGVVPIAPGEASEINRFQQSWSEELRFESLPPPPPPSAPDTKDAKDDGKDKNIITPTSTSPFHWRFGFFAQGKETEGDDLRTFSVPYVFTDPFSPVPLTIYTPVAQRTLYTQHEDTIAGYANGGYTFGSLDVNAGLRVDYTRKTLERFEMDGLFGTDVRFSGEYDQWTAAPTFGLTFHVTKNVELFARTSYGFKPGGFSPYTESAALSAYKQESVWTTETGVHAEALDGKLRGTLTGYYRRFAKLGGGRGTGWEG